MKKSLKFTLFACSVIAVVAMAAFSIEPAAAQTLFDGGLFSQDASLAFVGAGLIVNRATINNLFTGFKAIFQKAFDKAPAMWPVIAMEVKSSSKSLQYGWLGDLPGVRKWVGDRVIHGLSTHEYTLTNDDFELTVGVDRNNIEDDELGIYSPMFELMGENTKAHPDEMVWELLPLGFSTPCYDGQNFFDTDHPVIDKNGDTISVANTDGGAGAAWFLMDDTRAIKPLIYQNRKDDDFVAMDHDTDANVFENREFVYGTHGRRQVGFALWQLIWGSKQTLDATNYEAARLALQTMTGDNDRKLVIRPTKLVVGPSNETAAKAIVVKERLANGEDNLNQGTAEVVVVPWLA